LQFLKKLYRNRCSLDYGINLGYKVFDKHDPPMLFDQNAKEDNYEDNQNRRIL